MTALLPPQTSLRSSRSTSRTADARDPRHRRPLVLLATLGGALAAASTLIVCMAVGMVGWFLTDAGAHGQPRDGLRAGALGWLAAHGSGLHVQGVLVSAVPLGITLICAWTTWRVAHKVGDSISGHGPNADRIVDGERDWIVPTAAALFAAGYVVVTVLTASLAASPSTRPSAGHSVAWALGIVTLLGVPGLAVGSGRAAIWAARLPAGVPAVLVSTWAVLRAYALACLVAVLAALALDLGTALNVLSQLGMDAKGSGLYAASTLLVLPNAALFAGAYLLGPGFAVGAGTLVAPTEVTLGPLPLHPLLAALPGTGPVPAWTPFLVALPPLLTALAVARGQRRRPVVRWDEAAIRGCAAGLLAGVVVGLVTALAGGSVGPGRMQVVAPLAREVLLHAVPALGIGGLVGALAMTWWQRRTLGVPEAPGATPDPLP